MSEFESERAQSTVVSLDPFPTPTPMPNLKRQIRSYAGLGHLLTF